MKNINLGIIEDELVFRKNIDQFFFNFFGFKFQGSVSFVEFFVEVVVVVMFFDIFLLDISFFGGMLGLEGIILFKECYILVDIIMWFFFEDFDKIFWALQFGVDFYLIKWEFLIMIWDVI